MVKQKLEIAEKLYEYFKSHIGQDKSVTKHEIFNQIFGSVKSYSTEDVYYKWQLQIKPAINYLRRKTNCFVVNKIYLSTRGKQTQYFVVTNAKESRVYKDFLEKNKTGINYMLKRVDLAVSDEYYKDYQNESFRESLSKMKEKMKVKS